MRVTQSMLSNNMLRNLSTSYNKMGKLQDQILTGKKVNRPSDDPVIAMKGIGHRTTVSKIAQYERNLGEVHNILDSSDDALDHAGQAMHRVKELMTNMANGTMTKDDRVKIQGELTQIHNQIQDLANTKVGEKYVFSGTRTGAPLYKDGEPNFSLGDSGVDESIEVEIFDGVTLKVNTNVREMFREIDEMFEDIETAVESGSSDFGGFLSVVDDNMDRILAARADIGARQNRVEMMENRLSAQKLNATKQMSENEDVDYEKAITEMITQESIHRAALSVGARIIQPSLVDFLR